MFIQKFLEICSRFEGAKSCFTDGDKDEEGAAIGITYNGYNTVVVPLPTYTSIFTAGAKAILRVQILASHKHTETNHILIESDSLSGPKALINPLPRRAIILQILLLIHSLRTGQRKQVTLCWCPGHFGVPGNERADKATKSAI